ncbi:Mrr restriction system protein [compost metagenome]
MKPRAKSKELASRVLHAGMSAALAAGGTMSLKDIKNTIVNQLSLDDWALEIIESNGLPRWETYLHFFSIDASKAGFLVKEKGIWHVTPLGASTLKLNPWQFLEKAVAGFRAWKQSQVQSLPTTNTADLSEEIDPLIPPEEQMLDIQTESNASLAAELLERLKAMSWQAFERVVVKVLIDMGYGGSRREAGRALQKSGDEGVDGIINEDKLGLDVIYIQAKKWTDTCVGRPEIQKFVGALAGKQANKGIFISTTHFSEEAKEYAGKLQSRIVLIDGKRLAALMIEHNVGVATSHTFSLKRIDSDFFEEG